LAPRWGIVVLILALAMSLIVPVYAHTTLGNLTGSGPYYRSNDHELNPTNTLVGVHVPGPLGYVWPGSGLDMYSGNPSKPPGYQSPFTTFENPTQLAGHSYAPEGAILTSTIDHDNVGDLILGINFSQPKAFISGSNPTPNFVYTSLAIYLPAPVFDKTGALVQDGFEPAGGINWDRGENTNIVTTITDNYGNIFVTRADRNDPFAPGSWLLFITAPNNITFTAARKWSEWYYIRINQMKAPFVAGRYFFKVFLDSHFPARSQGTLPKLINSTMPMENWPVLLVKGEVDPGIITGTLRYGDTANPSLYGLPLNLPGRIRAVGVAVDPLTNLSTGRSVEARGYFNASSQGHFEIEGVAPGIYDIYASAAGFPEQKIAEGIKISRAQSLHFDSYLQAGPQISGKVYSKEMFGSVSWPGQRPIAIGIYDSNTYDADSIVTVSPSNLTNAPYTSYVSGNVLFSGGGLAAPNTPKIVAFPWEGPLSYYGYTTTPNGKDPFGLYNGVGPAESWWVDPLGSLDPASFLGSSNNKFSFQFGAKGAYGAPAKFSGMVPQIFATWTDSLTPGKYYVRAFLNGYIQSSSDGTRFIDYSFEIPDGYSRDVYLPIDLEKSAVLNITVHFHDFAGTTQGARIGGPDPKRFLIAEAFARDGTFAALNFTQVPAASSQTSILLDGLGMAGPLSPPDPRASIKYSLARYRGIYDYGLPTDTYTVRLYMRGYIQALLPATSFDDLDVPLAVSTSIGTEEILVSTHMYRGGEINTTVFSVDWERPAVYRNWVWNNTSVSTLVYDVASQNFVDVIYFWNAKLGQWQLPKQNFLFNDIPYSGWKTIFGPGSSLLVTNGSALIDRTGPDIPNSISSDPLQDMPTNVFLEENFHLGFLYSSSSYRTQTFRTNLAIYPGVYAVNAWTYGYVQDNVAALGDLGNVLVSVPWLGSEADSNIQLIIGVNLTIRMVFKSEKLLSELPFNSSVRIRVFDEGDTLIAAATVFSDAGKIIPTSNAGFFADGTKLLQTPVPAGTKILDYVNLAGLAGYVDASTGGVNVQRATLFSPDHGIWGSSGHAGSYDGQWLVMVDVVNWYSSHSYYPPVPALLQGESPFFYPYNHLGPFDQGGYTMIPNAHQGGEASVEFELDLRGYVQGLVLALDWDYGARTTSWTGIQISANSTSYNWYSLDGLFDGYLDPGMYHVTVNEWTNGNQGHKTDTLVLAVNPGESNGAINIVLEESGIAIPELPATYTTLVVTLTASLGLLYCGKKRGNGSS
jgi:hypothetical protein